MQSLLQKEDSVSQIHSWTQDLECHQFLTEGKKK